MGQCLPCVSSHLAEEVKRLQEAERQSRAENRELQRLFQAERQRRDDSAALQRQTNDLLASLKEDSTRTQQQMVGVMWDILSKEANVEFRQSLTQPDGQAALRHLGEFTHGGLWQMPEKLVQAAAFHVKVRIANKMADATHETQDYYYFILLLPLLLSLSLPLLVLLLSFHTYYFCHYYC